MGSKLQNSTIIFISGDFLAVCNTMKDLLEELKRLIIRIVSIQNLICLAKSNNTTYQMGSRNIKEEKFNIRICGFEILFGLMFDLIYC